MIDAEGVKAALLAKLQANGGQAQVPLLKGGTFNATLVPLGVEVDTLGTQPFLPWSAFEEAVRCIRMCGGRAARGDAMQSRLRESGLPLNSVEGHVATVVYERKPGDTVFRRITPIACLLIWAGICAAEPSELVLTESAPRQPLPGSTDL